MYQPNKKHFIFGFPIVYYPQTGYTKIKLDDFKRWTISEAEKNMPQSSNEPNVIKYQSEINRAEWGAYNWRVVTEMTDKEPRYLRESYRHPSEVSTALSDFDLWIKCAMASRAYDRKTRREAE